MKFMEAVGAVFIEGDVKIPRIRLARVVNGKSDIREYHFAQFYKLRQFSEELGQPLTELVDSPNWEIGWLCDKCNGGGELDVPGEFVTEPCDCDGGIRWAAEY